MEIFYVIAITVSAFLYFSHLSRKRRRAYLMMKYDDADIVERIMKKHFWQGQSADQLMDSLGPPADIDSKIMKTKSRYVWKYHSTGKNRYRLRITIEDGEVVGWDHK